MSQRMKVRVPPNWKRALGKKRLMERFDEALVLAEKPLSETSQMASSFNVFNPAFEFQI